MEIENPYEGWDCWRSRTMMTYRESYLACKTLGELKAKMIEDTKVALIIGGNPDRIAAIETAGNVVLKEKGWIDDEAE